MLTLGYNIYNKYRGKKHNIQVPVVMSPYAMEKVFTHTVRAAFALKMVK